MTFTRTLSAATLTGGIALAGLFFGAVGTAGAAPGAPCGLPGAPACQQAPQNNDWQRRDIASARRDHQPFMYQGQRVEPLRAGNGDGWGFWFLGRWIAL